MWRDLPHTPATSLVKYAPSSGMSHQKDDLVSNADIREKSMHVLLGRSTDENIAYIIG